MKNVRQLLEFDYRSLATGVSDIILTNWFKGNIS